MGRLEIPAVVILGDGAVFHFDVRVNDLGTISLCCGHFWRNDNRDAGVRDWRKDYEVEGRRGHGAARGQRVIGAKASRA